MIQLLDKHKQYDIIGDIHGHYDELVSLLKNLGYSLQNGIWKNGDRTPVFVGDYIDRGPKILETLKLVRDLTESGNGIALMGNHEYNFICMHNYNSDGKPFRKRSESNLKSINQTLIALESENDFDSYLKWMEQLPVIAFNDSLRVVHAQWHHPSIELILSSSIKTLDQNGLSQVFENNALKNALDISMKGQEVQLPETHHFFDKDNKSRGEARLKWWNQLSSNKMDDAFASLPEEVKNDSFPIELLNSIDPYLSTETPVFFGHYWMNPSDFGLLSNNICCLDFSVANGGNVGGYRFDGESELIDNKLLKNY
ncbi:MAG: hypothetical protein RL528_888 [Bacteroidota bacterium]|jgi:hypothetical protein